jgi:hypothetical protein
MDPSLIEIIKQAVTSARRDGQGVAGQLDRAISALLALTPNLSPATARLVVDQLYPFVSDRGLAA